MAAFKRQCEVRGVENIAQSDLPLLGAATKLRAPSHPDTNAKYATLRGAAKWASDLLKRKLTFKQCSRNVVMTKLANSRDVSEYDTVAHMNVAVRTVQRYHRINPEARDVVSRVINAPLCKEVSIVYIIRSVIVMFHRM